MTTAIHPQAASPEGRQLRKRLGAATNWGVLGLLAFLPLGLACLFVIFTADSRLDRGDLPGATKRARALRPLIGSIIVVAVVEFLAIVFFFQFIWSWFADRM